VSAPRVDPGSRAQPVELDYKLVLNLLATIAFAALIYLTMRRGVTDQVCGMKVDRAKALELQAGDRTVYFCSQECRDAFEAGNRRTVRLGS
jgi:YHS domain-containing protein